MTYPILLDNAGKRKTVLKNCLSIVLEDELISTTDGYETLVFTVPLQDVRTFGVKNEMHIECNDRIYIIRLIEDSKSSTQLKIVTCDALWYDLADGEYVDHRSIDKFSAKQAIDEQLRGTVWKTGIIEITVPHQFSINEPNNRLHNLRYIQKVFGGDLEFDTKNKLVNLYTKLGSRTNNVFTFEKNLREIKRTSDTRDLVTRFTLTGKDGITIAKINNGIDYLENYEYYDSMGMPRQLKFAEKSDERFTNLEYMKFWMSEYLETNSKPILNYELNVAIMQETPAKGDLVYIYDDEFNIQQWLRVVSRKLDLLKQSNGSVILENPYKTTDYSIDSSVATGGGSSLADLSNASLYNLLMNSRADDGFSYWENDGFEIDDTSGKSGWSSFKSIGGTSLPRYLKQTVYPGTKDSYTVSGYIEFPEGYEYKPDSKIGVEVTIHYDDGKTQTEFVSVFGEKEEYGGEE